MINEYNASYWYERKSCQTPLTDLILKIDKSMQYIEIINRVVVRQTISNLARDNMRMVLFCRITNGLHVMFVC